MNDIHSNHTPYVRIQSVHDEVNIMEVVEVPALRDEGVTQYVMDGQGTDVVGGFNVSNP